MILLLYLSKEPFTVKALNEELKYENDGDAPWERYGVHQTIQDDPQIKYTNAHYYEYDNKEYQRRLKKTLDNMSTPLVVSNTWATEQTPDALNTTYQDMYTIWFTLFSSSVRNSEELLLPTETALSRTPIQVVHDRWISAAVHKTELNTIRFDTEVILYRSSKPHGKHVRMSVVAKIVEKNWKFKVTQVEIVGIIPEDQIVLFPVKAQNPFDKGEMKYLEDPSSFATTIIPPAQVVLDTIKRQSFMQRRFVESQMRVPV